jgi:hypothetical protein
VLVRPSPPAPRGLLTQSAGRARDERGCARPREFKSPISQALLCKVASIFDLLWRGERAFVGSKVAPDMISGFSKPRPDRMRPPFGALLDCRRLAMSISTPPLVTMTWDRW